MTPLLYLNFDKQTLRMVRYRVPLGTVDFCIYVPKWRIPAPWPKKIMVQVESLGSDQRARGVLAATARVGSAKSPIYAIMSRVSVHTRTVRFDPETSERDDEIGAIYVPYSLLSDPPPERILMTVKWGGELRLGLAA